MLSRRVRRLRRPRRACAMLLLGLSTAVASAWCVARVGNTPAGRRALNLAYSGGLHGELVQSGLGISITEWPSGDVSGRMGFPVYAMGYARTAGPPAHTETRVLHAWYSRGLDLPFSSRTSVNPPLPLRPLALGLLLDTAFYALLWWLMLASLRLARDEGRRRRGFCPVCRYDLRHDHSRGCPECGWGRGGKS